MIKRTVPMTPDSQANSCVKRQQGQQRTTMPCGLYIRIVPTYFLHITKPCGNTLFRDGETFPLFFADAVISAIGSFRWLNVHKKVHVCLEIWK